MDERTGCGKVVVLPAGNANSKPKHTMYTVSLSQHGNSTDLQSFAILDEARAFAKKERNQNEEHPDFRGAEWTISDDNGACWPTEEAAEVTAAPALPVSVAYSHSLADALGEGGCKSPGDFTVLPMPGGYGDCIILHSQRAFALWDALPKTHPDKCARGFGGGTGMYIRD